MSRGIKPTVIHVGNAFGGDHTKYKCGAPRVHWNSRYMTDEFAQSLPRCLDCGLYDLGTPQYVVQKEVAPLPDLFGGVISIDEEDIEIKSSLEWWAQ